MNIKSKCLETLSYWLALGIAIQIGTALWPIGNYATLVYWGFYAPLLLLIFFDHRGFYELFIQADSYLLTLLAFFLTWICISSLWTDDPAGIQATLLRSGQMCLLTIFYVIGIAYLAHTQPRIIILALCVAIFFAAALTIHTLVNVSQLIMENKLKLTFSYRLSSFTLANQSTYINAVVSGIYLGALSVASAALSISKACLTSTRMTSRILFFGLALLFLLVAVFTGTRTAIASLLITAITYLLLQKHYWTLTSITIFGLWICGYVWLDDSHALHEYLNRGGFGSWRPQIWLASIKSSNEHLLWGAGMWSSSTFEAVRGTEITHQPHAHNAYLQLLFWTGLVGLLSYLSLYFRTLYVVIRSQPATNPICLVSFCMLIYFAAAQFFDVYSVITKPNYYWLCIWLPIGIVVGISSNLRKKQ